MKDIIKNQDGFVALTSVIIIMLVLFVIVFSLSQNSFLGRFNIIDSEAKEKSLGLAEGCADIAVLKVANDPSYSPPPGGEDFTVEGDPCTVVSVGDEGGDKLIRAQASYNNAISRIEVVVDITNPSNPSIVSWKEVPSF